MSDSLKYDLRGVSASKAEVHDAIKHLSKGLYPTAFCKILPDIVGRSEDYCNIMHADTAGTKTSLAYIYWKETGDLSVWRNIVQDAIVMNVDDMACVGIVDDIVLSSTIGRNKKLIPGEVIKEVINGCMQFIDQMKELGINLHLSGGETADVGDIVRTIDIGYTTFARKLRKELVINDIEDGDVIVGISSSGQASYESWYNGGMGSNGLTSARHDVLDAKYRSLYPESFDPYTPEELVYSGTKKLTDSIAIPDHGTVTIGKLILSPTRTYMPVIKSILSQKIPLQGLIHCTGGGQTKVLNFVDKVKIVKDNLLDLPPLYRLIEDEARTTREEMYQVFNMGHRLECYCKPEYAVAIMDICSSFNIDSKVIGHVESSDRKELVIKDEKGEYHF